MPLPALQPPAPLPAPQPAPPGKPLASKIGEIIVIGNKTLSTTFIITAADVKVGDPCTDDTLNQIATKLWKTGLFGRHSASQDEAVKVRAEENNPSNGLCKVIIEVDENETIQQVSISGSGPIKPDVIQQKIHIKPGAVYNENQFLADTIDIQTLYRQQGFSAVVTGDSGPDPQNPSVLRVVILVARVADIHITGNRRTKKAVFLRVMQTKVGDYYNILTLNKDRQKLYNLGLFDDLNPSETDAGPGRVNITLSVIEKRTSSISAGIGYSNQQQLVGRVEYSDPNFRGMAESLNLLWETGGVVNKNSVELDFTEPYLDRHQTQLAVQLYDKIIYRFESSLFNGVASSNEFGTSTYYYEERAGATVTLSRPIAENWRGAVSFRGENVRTDNLDLDPENSRIIENGPLLIVGGTLLHNTRDLDLDPISGGFQSANLQLGGADLKQGHTSQGTQVAGLVGDVSFSKASLDLRQYISLQGKRKKLNEKKRALAVRLMFGSSVGQLPFFEQYFVGGADTMRGYREDRFWGTNMVLGSVELRQPIANALTGVVFVDAGDAWGGTFDSVNIQNYLQESGFTLHVGVGLGIRVRTPLGPLRLDYGIGSEGGQIHFSVGNAF